MYGLVIFFLLISSITSAFGRFFGSKISIPASIFFLTISFFLGCFVFYETTLMGYTCEIKLFDWINLFALYSPFLFLFDKLSSTMLVLVIFISLLIHIYASNYMGGDPSVVRFFFYLSLFTFFMCLMVVSGSLFQFFLAWEGVGLASYLLINFWYTRAEANRAAMKAMIVNRFGDFGLYFSILLIFAFFKTLTFNSLNAVAWALDEAPVAISVLGYSFRAPEVICFFLFLAVVGKSAQLGLHTWLPDAMEGPTPVSALLHAATMVTAGVYLLLRLSPFMELAPNVLVLISFWGGLTAFFAATVGAFQNDIKKIIAYSTCSQLGYMVAACGMHNYIGAFYHLFNHAFFKALLFLGAGSIIHALIDEQDLRKYGRLLNMLPLTYICMFIGSLSLAGIPFLSGFYSKDIIINWAYSDFSFSYQIVYWLLLFAAFFTAFYSTKLIVLSFFSFSPRFSKTQLSSITESDFRFKVPLILLAILSIISGYVFYDLFVGYGADQLGLATNFNQNYLVDLEYLSQLRKFTPVFFVLAGATSYIFFHLIYITNFDFFLKNSSFIYSVTPWKNLLSKKWFFDFFYYNLVNGLMQTCYKFFFKSFDKGIIEDLSVKKIIFTITKFSRIERSFQTSDINQYVLYFFNLVLLVLCFYLFLFNLNYVFSLMVLFYIISKILMEWRRL